MVSGFASQLVNLLLFISVTHRKDIFLLHPSLLPLLFPIYIFNYNLNNLLPLSPVDVWLMVLWSAQPTPISPGIGCHFLEQTRSKSSEWWNSFRYHMLNIDKFKRIFCLDHYGSIYFSYSLKIFPAWLIGYPTPEVEASRIFYSAYKGKSFAKIFTLWRAGHPDQLLWNFQCLISLLHIPSKCQFCVEFGTRNYWRV